MRARSLEKLCEVLAFALRKAHHELFVFPVFDLVDKFLVRVAEQVVDLLHLLVFVLGGQEGFACDELGEDATD